MELSFAILACVRTPGDPIMKFKLSLLLAAFLIICQSSAAYAAMPSDPCSLLTPAQVSAALGVTVGAGEHLASKLCQWTAPNQPNSMNAKKVTLTLQNAQQFGYAKMPVGHGITKTPVSGVGDEAVSGTSPGTTPGLATTLAVRKGDSAFTVHVYGVPDEAKVEAAEKALALEVLAKM